MKSAFVGQKTVLKQNVSLNDKIIQSISCLYGSKIYSITFKALSRNGIVQKIEIGYPPENSSDKTQVETHELPIYQFIRCITYFGTIEENHDEGTAGDHSKENSSPPSHHRLENNGEPLMEKNGQSYIIPENLKRSQYIKLTGIMFDIVS